MPGLDGLEVQERVAATGAKLGIVFLTGHGDIPTSVRAVRAGALDFLTKPVRRDDLLRAVHAALAHARAQHAAAAANADLRGRYAQLTPREREVFTHVIAGKLNKVIAADLGTDRADDQGAPRARDGEARGRLGGRSRPRWRSSSA